MTAEPPLSPVWKAVYATIYAVMLVWAIAAQCHTDEELRVAAEQLERRLSAIEARLGLPVLSAPKR